MAVNNGIRAKLRMLITIKTIMIIQAIRWRLGRLILFLYLYIIEAALADFESVAVI